MPNLRYLDQIGVTIVSAAHGRFGAASCWRAESGAPERWRP